MLKKIAIAAFFTLVTATSSVTLAANSQVSERTNIVSAVNDVPATQQEHTTALTSANAGEATDAGTLSPSASAWMLGLALVGFVLLSNRRAI
ncbi:MAG TPA: hypothetical protein PL131_10460 [Methylotenera sp.]|nr:hypothetical protein [Methylotenera sp.]HPH06287.1 hypothetical protein [Methylotenera sp.]HPN00367.1 hypothetical protein [Methylotenera sp.]